MGLLTYLQKVKRNFYQLAFFATSNNHSKFVLFANNLKRIVFQPAFDFFVGSNVTSTGNGLYQIQDKFDIGITGLHDIFRNEKTVISNHGKIIVKGSASIGKGSKIYFAAGSEFIIGNNSYITGRATIAVNAGLSIGNNCALAWSITIIDSDYHNIFDIDEDITAKPILLPITIGDNVWIGCNTTILKGVHIATGVVVAANSVVNKSILEENVLVAGNPARIVRRNVKWRR